jgi:hypothetical protein
MPNATQKSETGKGVEPPLDAPFLIEEIIVDEGAVHRLIYS